MSILDTKNPSPTVLSLFTAFIIAVTNTLLSLAFRPQWYVLLIVFATTFCIIYYLYYYTLQRFIYRKIKLIYKFIYQTKATKKEEFFYNNILPQKSLEDVGNDVQRWAMQKSTEIAVLRKNENFRKEFLSNLAHELRTPIFTVQGYVDTLLNGALEDPEVNIKFLKTASRSIDRLVQLVDDLGEISKLESGKIALVQTSFIIHDLVKEVYEEFDLQAEKKNIILEFKKGTERPLMAYADKLKIKQVLSNLIENGIKYTQVGGTITTGIYAMDERKIYVEVSDNGSGIPENHLPRIFERFYRADKSRNSEIGGTGLGLAIVKHIIEAHGENVTVRSKPGVGSSFGFTIQKDI